MMEKTYPTARHERLDECRHSRRVHQHLLTPELQLPQAGAALRGDDVAEEGEGSAPPRHPQLERLELGRPRQHAHHLSISDVIRYNMKHVRGQETIDTGQLIGKV
jgi:hypothetical protein